MPGISSELSCLSIRYPQLRHCHSILFIPFENFYRFLPVSVVCGSELRVRNLDLLQSDGKFGGFAGNLLPVLFWANSGYRSAHSFIPSPSAAAFRFSAVVLIIPARITGGNFYHSSPRGIWRIFFACSFPARQFPWKHWRFVHNLLFSYTGKRYNGSGLWLSGKWFLTDFVRFS